MDYYAPVVPGAPLTYSNATPNVVLEDLSSMQGSSSGFVKLPVVLDWTPVDGYDMSDRADVVTMYETVLRSARNEEPIQKFLNRDVMIDVWSSLILPKHIRSMWESLHPELA